MREGGQKDKLTTKLLKQQGKWGNMRRIRKKGAQRAHRWRREREKREGDGSGFVHQMQQQKNT